MDEIVAVPLLTNQAEGGPSAPVIGASHGAAIRSKEILAKIIRLWRVSALVVLIVLVHLISRHKVSHVGAFLKLCFLCCIQDPLCCFTIGSLN